MPDAIAETGAEVLLDGAGTFMCAISPAGLLEGKMYESRTCSLQVGTHRLTGPNPFGIVVYGYGDSASYAVVGGANLDRVYAPPPFQ